MQSWQRFFDGLIFGLATIAGAVLAFAMCLTTADVIMRYFFNSPIAGTYEIIELAMGILSPLAILYCSKKGAHVSVEIVYNFLPPSLRRITLIFSLLCSLAVFAVLAWQGWHLIFELSASNLSSPILELPVWSAAITIHIGFLLIIPITMLEIYRAATKLEGVNS